MNSVDRVKAICKERKIAISKLEKDLGFSNGYISQLRKGSFPAERLVLISNYLSVSTEFLMSGEDVKENSPDEFVLTEGEKDLLELFRLIPADQQPVVLAMIRAALGRK
jgi:transcriptional regulator with XRE-family HTH domain